MTWFESIGYKMVPYSEATHMVVRTGSCVPNTPPGEIVVIATAKCELDAWRLKKVIKAHHELDELVVMPTFEPVYEIVEVP